MRGSKLQVIAFGKLKNPACLDLADEYRTRIAAWMPIEEAELKPHPERQLAHRAETQALDECLARANKSGRPRLTILLDSSGPSWTTEKWAEVLQSRDFEVSLAIGSTWGWSNEVLARKDIRKVSFGSQTMAHELARVVLYEQIYRALCALRNHPYHFEKNATL